MSEREFQDSDGKSHKFWRIDLDGCTHTVQFGRIGTTGRTQTNTLVNDAEARRFCERLIQEKLKKGYVEVTASPSQTLATGAAPVPEPENVTAVPTADLSSVVVEDQLRASTAAPSSAGVETVAPEPTRRLHLDPIDWIRATWRPWEPPPRPAPPPFDLQAALERLARLPAREIRQQRWTGERRWWEWDWTPLASSPSLTREEALFWLRAMTILDNQRASPDELGASLAQQQFGGSFDLDMARREIGSSMRYYRPEIMIPLVNLLSLDELVDLLVAPDEIEFSGTEAVNHGSAFEGHVLAGFRSYVLPYLSPSERKRMCQRISPLLDPSCWPSGFRSHPPPMHYHLAARLGCSAGLLPLVESWPDDCFSAGPRHADFHLPKEIIFGLGNPALVEAHMRRLRLHLDYPGYIRAWLAHTEYSALDYVTTSILAVDTKDKAEPLIKTLALAEAPETAPCMLQLMLESKAPQVARHWLQAHSDHAIAGLVPVAAGRGRLAEAAAEFLRAMRRKGHEAALRARIHAQAPEVGERVRAAVLDTAGEQIPAFDEATTPERLQTAVANVRNLKWVKKPTWVDPAFLPPFLVGAYRLSDEQTDAVLLALQNSQATEAGELIGWLKEAADRSSLDDFAWKLFDLWQVEGAPSGDKWALVALGLLGSDAIALKLAPLIREWPGENQHARAVLGLECLRTIGTDAALMQISGIAQKTKFKGLKAKALECMEAIARERGLSRDESEDRIVPDCGLDERGARVFDFGPRQFHLLLGPDLKPLLRDETGKLRPDLPKPASKDDAERASPAAEEWKLLKKQVADVAKIQAARLEQAMVTGRRWPRDAFETLLVQHPLMIHLVRRLAWAGYAASGERLATFRVTEDGTYADAHDRTAAVDEVAEVEVVHPLHLTEAERSQWGELLSDYVIVPPFPQLGRPIYRLEPGEAEKSEISRFGHVMIPAASLVGTLERLGWTRAIPRDHGWFYEHSKPFYGSEVTAIVQYEGVMVGEIVTSEDQRIEHCFFVPGIYTPIGYHTHKERVPLGQIDPVAISEVLSDLTTVAAKAR